MPTQTHPARRLLDHALAGAAGRGSDRELLARFLAGDQAAFAAIVDRHGPMLRGCCRRWVDDAHLADDVLQATFVVLARKASSIRRRDGLAAWLYGVARRVARRARLAEEARSHRERAAASRANGERNPECDELRRALDEELARLPEGERAALVLCYLEGRTQDEAATQLGLPLITLRRHLERGRERLRARLTRRGLTLGAALLAIDAPALGDELRDMLITSASVNGAEMAPSVVALADGLRLTAMSRAGIWSVAAVLICGVLAGAGWLRAPARGLPTEPPAKPAAEVKRDRFNDPLPAGAVARLGTLSFRHGEETNRVRFSADGKSLWSGSDGLRRRWQLDTGQEVETFDFRDGGKGIRTDCLSDDGKTMVLVYGKTDRFEPAAVVVRDTATRNIVREFSVPYTGYGYVLSPDARLLALTRGNGETEVWDVAAGQLRFKTPTMHAMARFSADGRTCVLCGSGQAISVWDTASGERRREFGGGIHDTKGIALSKDGKWLVTHGRTFKPDRGGSLQEIPDDSLTVWDVEKGTAAATLKTGWLLVSRFTLTPDGRTLLVPISSFQDGRHSVQRWDVATGKLIAAWPSGLDSCTAAALSRDGKTLATASQNGCVRLWDTVNRRELGGDAGHRNAVHMLAFSRDGNSLTTYSVYDNARIEWDLNTGKSKARREAPKLEGAATITYSADMRYRLALVSHPDSRILVWDLDGDAPPRELGRVPNLGRGFALSPDGRRAVVVGDGPTVRSWEVASGKLLAEWKFEADANARFNVRALEDGRTILTSNDGLLLAFDTDGREFRRLRVEKPRKPGEFAEVVLSPSSDGRYITCFANAGRDWQRGTLEIRELATGGVVRRIAEDVARGAAAFSPDAKRIATVSPGPEQTIIVWDIATGTKRHEFKGHRGKITGLAFSPDGKRLATGSEDCTVLVWDIER